MPPKKKPVMDVELQDDGPDLPVEDKSAQFPSLAGDPDTEIQHRTADGPNQPGKFTKTFVIDVDLEDPAVVADGHALVMRQEAVQRGLRATGDPELVNTTRNEHRRGVTTELTYAMPVTPAAAPGADAGPA